MGSSELSLLYLMLLSRELMIEGGISSNFMASAINRKALDCVYFYCVLILQVIEGKNY